MRSPDNDSTTLVHHFFTYVVRSRGWLLPLLLLVPIAFAVPLAGLDRDLRSDAFMEPDNPALVYRNVVKERFGLVDPILVAVVSTSEGGVFDRDSLSVVKSLSNQLALLPNIDGEGVFSLGTVSAIESGGGGLDIVPLLETIPRGADAMQALKERISAFPVFTDDLIADDDSATLLVLQLLDEQDAEDSYYRVLDLIDGLALPSGVDVHVAGEGAVTGYLGAYVDADARILNPIAAVIILLVIALAFRNWAAPLLAIVMIASSCVVALGAMALAGIPFYVVTNAMPVILIGIAVADTIHVCSRFALKRGSESDRSPAAASIDTLVSLWRPITITSATTIAGFLGLYFASEMPPFRYFGLFTALGVFVAWLYTILCLPCCLSYRSFASFSTKQGKLSSVQDGTRSLDSFVGRALRRLLEQIWNGATQRPKVVVAFFTVIIGAGLLSSLTLEVDDNRIGIFHHSEKIAIANDVISERLGGTGTLDVIIETGLNEGILEPELLLAMEQLQIRGERIEGVAGSRSIVDYLKQMNGVLSDSDSDSASASDSASDPGLDPDDMSYSDAEPDLVLESDPYAVPDSSAMAAQFLLLYNFAGDPADFNQLIDYEYTSANIRFLIKPSSYRGFAPVVEALRTETRSLFEGLPADVNLSGRISLDYEWLQAIERSHWGSVLAAVLMVFVVSAASFGSIARGALSLIPVVASVLGVYTVMSVTGIPLGVGTSMFAAVAIGLGVDFAVHTIARFIPERQSVSEPGESELKLERAVDCSERRADFYSSTGRPLMLNFIAVSAGFAVLMLSEISQLAEFGLIVLTAVGVSFFASLTLIPACFSIRRSRS
ncbi:MAG: efflux RND transporter permease subunit [Pseudomonadota bacterium]